MKKNCGVTVPSAESVSFWWDYGLEDWVEGTLSRKLADMQSRSSETLVGVRRKFSTEKDLALQSWF